MSDVGQLTEDVLAFTRLFGAFEREAICGDRVSVAQCVVLQTLREGEWDVSSLAARTRVTNGAVTRLVDGLEKRGLVTRLRDTEDRRRVRLELTKEGRREADFLRKETERAVTAILARVPAKKRAAVTSALRLFRQATEAARDEIECC